MNVALGSSFAYYPVARGLRAARDRAGRALVERGATIVRPDLRRLRRAYELYVIALKHSSSATSRAC